MSLVAVVPARGVMEYLHLRRRGRRERGGVVGAVEGRQTRAQSVPRRRAARTCVCVSDVTWPREVLWIRFCGCSSIYYVSGGLSSILTTLNIVILKSLLCRKKTA